jgi:urate oxidase
MQGDMIGKNTKIHDVEKVKLSPHNMMNMRNDPSSKPVFFSGMSERKVPNQANNSIVKSAIMDMRVVETVDSAWMNLAPEENIFVMIPRKTAIKKLLNVNKTLLSMSALNKAKVFAEKCGNK